MLIVVVVIVVARVAAEQRHQVRDRQSQLVQVDAQVRDRDGDELPLVGLVVWTVAIAAAVLGGHAGSHAEHNQAEDNLLEE